MRWVDLLDLSSATVYTHLCSHCVQNHLTKEKFTTICIPNTIFPTSTFFKDFLQDFENQITKLGDDIDVALSYDSCEVHESAVFCFDNHHYRGFIGQFRLDDNKSELGSSYLLFLVTSIKTGWCKAFSVYLTVNEITADLFLKVLKENLLQIVKFKLRLRIIISDRARQYCKVNNELGLVDNEVPNIYDIWHLRENLVTNLDKLFPNGKNILLKALELDNQSLIPFVAELEKNKGYKSPGNTGEMIFTNNMINVFAVYKNVLIAMFNELDVNRLFFLINQMYTILMIFKKNMTLTENDTINLSGFLNYYTNTFQAASSDILFEISNSVRKLLVLHTLVPELQPVMLTTKAIEDVFHSRPVNTAYGIDQYLKKICNNPSSKFLSMGETQHLKVPRYAASVAIELKNAPMFDIDENLLTIKMSNILSETSCNDCKNISNENFKKVFKVSLHQFRLFRTHLSSITGFDILLKHNIVLISFVTLLPDFFPTFLIKSSKMSLVE
jgi:hypothetical protein